MARWNHLLSLMDLTSDEVHHLLELARQVKATPGTYGSALAGKTLGMIFQKSSTRTRVSFEVGIHQLGGYGLFLSARDIQLGRGETMADTARVLSRYVDGLMARVYGHEDLVALASYGSVPVINGLSDLLHPCQALADYLTLLERRGSLDGARLAYVGDGNNVAHSLIQAGALLGVDVAIACPEGHEPNPAIVDKAREVAAQNGAHIEVTRDPHEAVAGADAVYTDVWTSMGQEDSEAERRRTFAPYQVDLPLFETARPDAVFLHCLPAHRGLEVTDAVADHERSAIFDQAENRLHAQKAVLIELMA